jgi:glycosyltransferase involved in cell wall biosynthesis
VTVVHVLVPEGIDDPARPSGGNVFDRRVCRGLAALGWVVQERPVPGSWPAPDGVARATLVSTLSAIRDGALVLLDGLIASTAPEALVPEAGRLRLVVLVHTPLGHGLPGEALPDARARERAVLRGATAVVATSEWTRRWLLEHYDLPAGLVHVARPGADPAGISAGSRGGGGLLCVAAVTPVKGQDLLLAALASVVDRPWRCECVGDLTRDPGFVASIARSAREGGIGDRIRFTGPRTGSDLDAAYAAADVLVLASRVETYGMVITEAMARGLPVVATAVGGVPEAVGYAADGSRPGLLVPPGDAPALGGALRRWLGDPDLRHRLRQAAIERRATVSEWSDTAARVSRALTEASA